MAARRFYITTPIYYVSDPPHIGHAYTTIVADAIARYHRMRGDRTHYLTGTDEHGQKIARIAEERGKSPKAYADEIAGRYREAWRQLGIAHDDFIRTTDADHEAEVQALWRKLEQQGDIYLADYEGPYCVSCEQFYTEKELVDGLCPVHKRPVEIVKEQSYNFRLSKYEAWLREWLETPGPLGPRVQPPERLNEVLSFVRSGLRDLSVSRTTFTWGVPVPDHPPHVVYVWIDALSNYYSATLRKGPTRGDDFWSEGTEIVHVLGKEISRFHAVYWPAMLKAAGLRTPDLLFCHGWWTVDGEKMSKTAGNVVDPLKLAADLGADAVRYFVLREVPLGLDGDFSHEALLTRFNSELANDLGNLLNRTLGMVHKYFPDGKVPPRAAAADPLQTLDAVTEWAAFLDRLEPSRALEELFALVRRANAYVDRAAPWKADADKATILGNVLEGCRVIAHLMSPVMPERARALLAQLGPELREQRASTLGHHRRHEVRDHAAALEDVAEDRRLVGVRLPRRRPIDVGVRAAHQREQLLERARGLEPIEERRPLGDGVERLQRICGSGARRHLPVGEVLVHHAERAVEEVAEVVRELAVEARQQGLVREVAVEPERHLAEHEVADRVRAEVGGELQRIDHVARGLRHLLAVDGPPAVAEEEVRRAEPRGLQHRRPVDRVEARDLLAEHVDDLGPLGPEVVAARRSLPQRRGVVVRQGVDPHVDDVRRVVGHGDAPGERRPRHRQVAQPRAHEREHLVEPLRRLHARPERPRGLEPLAQPRLVLAEPEVVRLLLHDLDGTLVHGAQPVDQLLLGVELLARDAVRALVVGEVDVALLLQLPPQRLHLGLVIGVRRADEVVVRDAELPPRLAVAPRDLVGVGLRRLAALLRDARDLLPVLVGAGEVVGAIAAHAVVARDRVGDDRRVRVPDVRRIGDVVDGRRDVEATGGHGAASIGARRRCGQTRVAATSRP